MLTVSFLRHATTQWNTEGLMQGRRDIPLSPSGREEVARWCLPLEVGEPVEWISSPLSRAIETARQLGGSALRIEPALTEMDWGAWEGARLPELRTRLGDEFTRNEQRGLDFRPPGGESPRDVVVRVARWLNTLSRHDRPIVAVTHNGVLRALLSIATGWDMTHKPPIRLLAARVHRFALERGPKLTLVACNLPLAPRAAAHDAKSPLLRGAVT